MHRSCLGSYDEGGRSFKNKVVDEGKSALNSSLDRDDFRFDDLEGKQSSSKEVNSVWNWRHATFSRSRGK